MECTTHTAVDCPPRSTRSLVAFLHPCLISRYVCIEAPSVIDQARCVVSVKIKCHALIHRPPSGAMSTLFCVFHRAHAARFICPLDRSSQGRRGSLEWHLSFHRSRVAVSISYAHKLNMVSSKHAKKERENVSEFGGRSSGHPSRSDYSVHEIASVMWTSIECSDLQGELYRLPVGVPDCFTEVAITWVWDPSDVVREQVDSSWVNRPVFACFQARLLKQSAIAVHRTGSDHPRRTS